MSAQNQNLNLPDVIAERDTLAAKVTGLTNEAAQLKATIATLTSERDAAVTALATAKTGHAAEIDKVRSELEAKAKAIEDSLPAKIASEVAKLGIRSQASATPEPAKPTGPVNLSAEVAKEKKADSVAALIARPIPATI